MPGILDPQVVKTAFLVLHKYLFYTWDKWSTNPMTGDTLFSQAETSSLCGGVVAAIQLKGVGEITQCSSTVASIENEH